MAERQTSFGEDFALGFMGTDRFLETQQLWQNKAYREEHAEWAKQTEAAFKQLDALATAAHTEYAEMLESDSFTQEELFKVRQKVDSAINRVATQKMDLLANAAAVNPNPFIKDAAQKGIQQFVGRMEVAAKQTEQVLAQYGEAVAGDEAQAVSEQGRGLRAGEDARRQEGFETEQELRMRQDTRVQEGHEQSMSEREDAQVRARKRDVWDNIDRRDFEGKKHVDSLRLGAQFLTFLKDMNVPEEEWDSHIAEVTGGRITNAAELQERWANMSAERKEEMQNLQSAKKAAEEAGDKDMAATFELELRELQAADNEDLMDRMRLRQVRRKGGKPAELMYRFRKGFDDIFGDLSEDWRQRREAAQADIKPDKRARSSEREGAVEQKYKRDLF